MYSGNPSSGVSTKGSHSGGSGSLEAGLWAAGQESRPVGMLLNFMVSSYIKYIVHCKAFSCYNSRSLKIFLTESRRF